MGDVMAVKSREDSAFTDDPGIGITTDFRLRLFELERIARQWGCPAGVPLDLDIIAYRIALNMKLDGSWRSREAGEEG
jgi:hypothetical protein